MKSKAHQLNDKPSGKRLWDEFPGPRLLVEVSLWSADLTCLADEIKRMDDWADMYHVDVSDAHFVPGLLFFADLVAAMRPLTKRPFHVHLMTDNPLNHVNDFAAAGADLISVHMENGPVVPAALDAIRRLGISAGLVLGLDVQIETIASYLDLVDMVLLMGTPMGIKGVKPSQLTCDRVRQVKSLVARNEMENQIKVFADGGIREETVPLLRAAGVDGVIAGSLVFKSPDLCGTFAWLHGL